MPRAAILVLVALLTFNPIAKGADPAPPPKPKDPLVDATVRRLEADLDLRIAEASDASVTQRKVVLEEAKKFFALHKLPVPEKEEDIVPALEKLKTDLATKTTNMERELRGARQERLLAEAALAKNKDDVAAQKRVAAAVAKEKTLSETLPNLKSQADALRTFLEGEVAVLREILAVGDANKAKKTGLAERVAALLEKVKTMDLKSDIQDLANDAESLQLALELMEARYDNSLMGQYVRQKLDRLLTSKEFCDAKDACNGAKPGGDPSKANTDKLWMHRDGSPGAKRGESH